jgi:hypothetical protein
LLLGLGGMLQAGESTVTLDGFQTGAFRWKDVGGNLYSAAYQAGYSYTQSCVRITYTTNGTLLRGTLTAANLKPNFAYQLKLSGQPEAAPAANEALGFSGRWWREEWNGTQWANGGNLNAKGDGYSPNPNDIWYLDHKDDPYTGSPTGLRYRFTGYRPFDYFITDTNGNASLDFVMRDTYHVLFGDWQGAPGVNDGSMKLHAFDPDPAAHSAYDTDYPAATNGVYGEWERLPRGGIFLAPGDYDLDFLLTEESFHESGLGGTWAHAVHGPARFTIVRPVIAATAEPSHGGTLSISGTTEIACGGNTNVAILPAAYWEIAEVVVDGISRGATGAWDFAGVIDHHSITGRFRPLLAAHDVPHWWLAGRNSAWTNDFDAAAVGDADGDGQPTWHEHRAGTDPMDRDSLFRIASATVVGGTNRIAWLSPCRDPDLPPFGMLRSTNLSAWTLVDGAAGGAPDGTNVWWERHPPSPPAPLFYRVTAPPRRD